MRVLGFEGEGVRMRGKRLRRACFERRSMMALSSACVVASGVREMLAGILGQPVSLRLLAPVLPDPQGWRALCAGAALFGVRGPACEAAFVLRPREAVALAACAFGETVADERPLSTIEAEVLLRAVRALAGSLAPLCGAELGPLERLEGDRQYVTYFELLVERPAAVRIGIALSKDPCSPGTATLRLEDLLDVRVEVSVECARGTLEAGAFLDLRPGADVPMTTRIGEPGCLKLGGAVLARGECGAIGERSALIVTTVR